jgi:hypothetical protein
MNRPPDPPSHTSLLLLSLENQSDGKCGHEMNHISKMKICSNFKSVTGRRGRRIRQYVVKQGPMAAFDGVSSEDSRGDFKN